MFYELFQRKYQIISTSTGDVIPSDLLVGGQVKVSLKNDPFTLMVLHKTNSARMHIPPRNYNMSLALFVRDLEIPKL